MGSGSSGPDSFTVETKTGETLFYGTTADSAIEAQGTSTIVAWALAQVSDSVSNYYTVTYDENTASGEYVVSQIDYTGNANEGVSPYQTIRFEYETRPDTRSGYRAGSKFTSSKRLSNIITAINQYTLTYKPHITSRPSRLEQIEYCDAAGTTCREPIELSWAGDNAPAAWVSNNNFIPNHPFVNSEGESQGTHLVDLNSDGFIDVVKKEAGPCVLIEGPFPLMGADDYYECVPGNNANEAGSATGLSGSVAPELPMATDQYDGLRFVDVDGDGDMDLLRGFNKARKAWLQDNGAWVLSQSYTPPQAFSALFHDLEFGRTAMHGMGTRLVDLNGDGLVDILHAYAGVRKAWLNTGNGWQQAPQYAANFGHDFDFEDEDTGVRLLDLNGDGLVDIVNGQLNCHYDYGSMPDSHADDIEVCPALMPVHLGSLNGWVEAPEFTLPIFLVKKLDAQITKTNARFADVNGDGLPDLLLGNNGAWLNTGKGWVSAPEYISPVNLNQSGQADIRWQFIDVNGDGRVELMSSTNIYEHNGSAWVSSAYQPPSGMSEFATFAQSPNRFIDRGVRPVDMNSDGFIDIISGQQAWINQAERTQLVSITTNNNQVIDIDYRSQLDAIVYTDDNSGQQTPHIREVKTPMQLVYEINAPTGSVSNGQMGQRTTRYHYKGLLAHTQGLGSLGFNEVTQTDLTTGYYSINRYRQDYPFVGMPISTQNYTDGDLLLNEMNVIEFEHIQTQASSECVRSGFVDAENTACTINDIAVPVLPYVGKKEEIVYHINDAISASLASSKTVSETTYDTDGNPTDIIVTITGAGGTDASEYKTVTTNNYNDGIDTPQCHLGLLKEATVTTRVAGQTDANSTRTTAFEYNPSSCLLTKDIIEPNAGADIRLETVYQHDNFGNVTHTTVTNGVTSRTTTTSYNPADYMPTGKGVGTLSFSEDGRFPVKISNALGHSEFHAFDPDFGLEKSMTGPNGLRTCWDYDSLGRKTLERQRCGEAVETKTTFAVYRADPFATGLAQAALVTVSQSSNADDSEVLPESRVYVDHAGRKLRSTSYSFSDWYDGFTHDWRGQLVFVDTVYDELGRPIQQSAPYYGNSGSFIYWAITDYDDLDRVQSLLTPLGDLQRDGGNHRGTISTDYLGFAIEVTDLKGRIKREEKNANGQLVRLVQAQGTADETTLEYTYTKKGNLETTQIVGRPDTLVTLGYDVLGRKTSMADPDMGNWSYQFNAFGDLRQQTDAKGQVTIMAYDNLGRLETRTDLESNGSTAQVSSWSYYDSLSDPIGSIGKLKQESADNQTSTRYTYDQYGRQASTTQNTTGNSFVSSQTYDNMGRVQTVTYPAVGSEPAYSVERHYNSLGFLWYITGPDSTVYWIADSLDERGQLEQGRNHNATEDWRQYDRATGWLQITNTYTEKLAELIQYTDYTFDEVGNVMNRRSRLLNDEQGIGESPTATETFNYDDLDRIAFAEVSRPDDVDEQGVATPYLNTKNYDQDILGNITYKSDVGYYRYGNECSTNAAGPHAVCEVVDGSGSTLHAYQYDANGNMVWGGANGFERNITYSTFNKPTKITQGQNETRFTYAASRSRVSRYSEDADNRTQTYYVGLGKTNAPLYEVETDLVTNEESHLHFIYAGGYHNGHPFMMQVVKRDQNDVITSTGQEYMHRDHLGSVIAVSDQTGRAISGPNQQNASNKSFDAWGKRRNPDWTEGDEDPYTSDRGHLCFTGQESITNVGLVHMNGRVYDPELGRFISADPHVQFVKDSQSYNRYSYVQNNPLKYTDPSGYFLSAIADSLKGLHDSLVRKPTHKVLNHIPANTIAAISVVLSFTPFAWVVPIINAAYADAQGAEFKYVFSAAVESYVLMQVGKGMGKAIGPGYTAVAVSAAFNSGWTAMKNGTNIRRGIIQGVAKAVVLYAVVQAASRSPAEKVTQGSKVERGQANAVSQANSNSPLSARQAAARQEINNAVKNGSLDPNKVFTGEGNIDAAAKEVLTVSHPISEKYDVELGGRIVPNGNGVSYEIPTVGDAGGVYIDPTGAVAGYHTHPGGSDYNFFSNRYTTPDGSPGDAGWVSGHRIPLYMSNYDGSNINFFVCNGGGRCMTSFNPRMFSPSIPQSMRHRGLSGKVVR